MQASTRARKRTALNSFGRKSVAPSSIARATLSMSPSMPEITRTGIEDSRLSARITSSTPNPSIPGIIISRRIRSTSFSFRMDNAASPLSASMTRSCPSFFMAIAIFRRLMVLSSTTRTRLIGDVCRVSIFKRCLHNEYPQFAGMLGYDAT